MTSHIYRFFWDCGRMGQVSGVFVSDEAVIAAVIGKRVYFGEILGKHSDIDGDLKESDFTVVPDVSPEFVAGFKKTFPNGIGYNPLGYLSEE